MLRNSAYVLFDLILKLSEVFEIYGFHLNCLLVTKLLRLKIAILSDLMGFALILTSHYKGLFTWREDTPGNQAIQLEGLKHSPPLQATHLPGTVSGLRGLSSERPLSTTNITATKESVFHLILASCSGTVLFSA